jgi:hypothetical protein
MNVRVIMRIEVEPAARDELQRICGALGMTQVAVNSRMIDWLCEQTDVVQAGVLGLLPAGTDHNVVKLALKQIASCEKQPGATANLMAHSSNGNFDSEGRRHPKF